MLHDFEPAIEIDLEPVDSVRITTLMDNVTDVLMPHQGPARRVQLGTGPRRAATVMDNGEVPDALIAEHGFSVLVTVSKGDREYRLLYDAGTSSDGVVENMRRLVGDDRLWRHMQGGPIGLPISQTGTWAYTAFATHSLAHLPTPDPATVHVSRCDKNCVGVYNTLK